MHRKSFRGALSVIAAGTLRSIRIGGVGLLIALLPVNRVDAYGGLLGTHKDQVEARGDRVDGYSGLIDARGDRINRGTAGELQTSLLRETTPPAVSYQQQSRSRKWLLATELVARMKIVGITTPLPSTRRTWSSETQFSSLQVNSAIHFEILEVLYGNYKVGDTVVYLQAGNSTADLIKSHYYTPPLSQQQYLLFLIPFEKLRTMWKSEIKENDHISIIPDMPTEVRYPVFGSSWGRYIIRGDRLNAVGCLLSSEVSYPGTLAEAKEFVKQLKLDKAKNK